MKPTILIQAIALAIFLFPEMLIKITETTTNAKKY